MIIYAKSSMKYGVSQLENRAYNVYFKRYRVSLAEGASIFDPQVDSKHSRAPMDFSTRKMYVKTAAENIVKNQVLFF